MSLKTKFGIAAAVALLLAGAMSVPVYYLVSYLRGMDLYKRGVGEMDEGRPDEAIPLFDAAARKNLDATNLSYVYGWRGWAYYGKGLDNEAIRDFTEAIRLNAKPAYAFLDRGLAYHRQGEFEKALVDYGEALARDPNLVEAYQKRAQICEGRGDWVQAIADYGEMVRCEPENAQFLVDRGMAFAANNELDGAIANFDAAIGFNQTHAGAYIQRAAAYGRKGDAAKGLADVTEAIRRLPKALPLWYARAMIYLDRGAVEEAIADCDESLRLDPKYDLGYLTRAWAELERRDWDKVLRDAEAALELTPALARAHYLRGRAFTARSQFDEAISEFDEALRLDPALHWAVIGRAAAYGYRHEYSQALAELRRAVERFPGAETSHRGLAWFLATSPHAAKRNGAEAIAAGLRACEISYWNNWSAVDVLAAAYAEYGEFDRAIEFANLALDLPGSSPQDRRSIRDRLFLYRNRMAVRDMGTLGGGRHLIDEGVAACAVHDYDHALRCFNAVLPPNPGESVSAALFPLFDGTYDPTCRVPSAASARFALTNAFYYRGLAYQRKRQWNNAISDFTTVIRWEPESTLGLCERGVTYSMKGQTDRGLRDFDEVIRLRPREALAYSLRADTLQLTKQWDAAVAAATTAIQLDPRLATAYHIRALGHLGQKDYDSAARDFTEADRLDPNHAPNLMARARVFNAKGDYGAAARDFRAMVERAPRFASAHNALAWFLATCPDAAYRDGAEAVVHARYACELTQWTDAAELDTLAAAYAEAGDFDQAVKYVAQAISQMEPDAPYREEVEGHLALFQRKEACRAKPPE